MAIPTLTLGAMNLTDWAGVAYRTAVMASGLSKGAPVPINVAIQSFLQDGSVVVTQGYDNREVTLRVQFRGSNLTAVCTAEAALFAELGKPNLLTWTPASGPASVFVVVTSSMEEAPGEDGDLAEAQPLPWRYYNIRLTCEAFTRSAATFTSVGVAPGGASSTTLDTCGATTGWSATVDSAGGTVTTAAGPPTSVAVTGTGLSPSIPHTLTLQKTFAATTSTTNLLMVDWLPSPSGASFAATGDGTPLPKFAESASPTSGYTRTWFTVAASSLAVTAFVMTVSAKGSGMPTTATLRIDNVAVTNIQPTIGTNRQQVRSVAVPGSAPTPGSLAVESATAALGDALVYVYPADTTTTGYSPSLRQFRTSGNAVTPDAAQVSGNTEPLNGSSVRFTIPIGLFPRGAYQLLGRLATSGGGTPTITYSGNVLIGANSVGAIGGSRAIVTTTAYQYFVLGRLQLPSVDLDPTAATAAVSLILDVQALAGCTYDEMWLFNTTIGRLVRVDCGTGAGTVGGSARRLFIEPPTTTTPRPTVRIGHSADRSDSFYPQTFASWQFPQFKPPQVNVLAVTPNATDAVISLSGYARWHTNAGS